MQHVVMVSLHDKLAPTSLHLWRRAASSRGPGEDSVNNDSRQRGREGERERGRDGRKKETNVRYSKKKQED
jgi:hypothetical protein